MLDGQSAPLSHRIEDDQIVPKLISAITLGFDASKDSDLYPVQRRNPDVPPHRKGVGWDLNKAPSARYQPLRRVKLLDRVKVLIGVVHSTEDIDCIFAQSATGMTLPGLHEIGQVLPHLPLDVVALHHRYDRICGLVASATDIHEAVCLVAESWVVTIELSRICIFHRHSLVRRYDFEPPALAAGVLYLEQPRLEPDFGSLT